MYLLHAYVYDTLDDLNIKCSDAYSWLPQYAFSKGKFDKYMHYKWPMTDYKHSMTNIWYIFFGLKGCVGEVQQ